RQGQFGLDFHGPVPLFLQEFRSFQSFALCRAPTWTTYRVETGCQLVWARRRICFLCKRLPRGCNENRPIPEVPTGFCALQKETRGRCCLRAPFFRQRR